MTTSIRPPIAERALRLDGTVTATLHPVRTIEAIMNARSAVFAIGWLALVACVIAGAIAAFPEVETQYSTKRAFQLTTESISFIASGIYALVVAFAFAAIARGVAAMLLALTAPRAE